MSIRTRLVARNSTALDDFIHLASSIIDYMNQNTIERNPSSNPKHTNFHLLTIKVNQRNEYVRPLNTNLFMEKTEEFTSKSSKMAELFRALRKERELSSETKKDFDDFLIGENVNKVIYTIQQSIGLGLDLFVSRNQSRRLVGLWFEDLICTVFNELDVSNNSFQFSFPLIEEEITYHCPLDLVINPKGDVSSNSVKLCKNDIIVSIKVSSKDRMSKIFVDKFLLERISKSKLKYIAIFHNDIQRKGKEKTSVTFVPDLFLVYSQNISSLDGVYFTDPPPHLYKRPWKSYLSTLQKLLTRDLWKM